MGWADGAIVALKARKTVCIKPHGNSMLPRIKSGQEVTIQPYDPKLDPPLKKGDVVLVKVNGTVYLHLVKGMNMGSVLIGNNKGRINGWTDSHNVYGKADI